MQERRPRCVYYLSGLFEHPHCRFCKSGPETEHKGYCEYDRFPGLHGQEISNCLAERHKPDLEAFHKEHQPDNDPEQSQADQSRICDRLFHYYYLEEYEVQGDRDHDLKLIVQPDCDVGFYDRERFFKGIVYLRPSSFYCPVKPGKVYTSVVLGSLLQVLTVLHGLIMFVVL